MKITAIVPAYNEAERIEGVMLPLLQSSMVSKILIVDDGSKDETVHRVSKYSEVDLIKMPVNRGKALAVKTGMSKCLSYSDVILLLDADLIGLTPAHIHDLLLPIVDGGADMTVGVFHSGRIITDMAQRIAPGLSGQRAFSHRVAEKIVNLPMEGYSLEMAFSKIAKKYNVSVETVILKDMTHVMKEEKVGIIKGMAWRMKMYKDIVKFWLN